MAKFILRWGIIATGGIAETFGRDILVDPITRDIHDIQHIIVAAASSNSDSRAHKYLESIGAPASAKAYGSYKALLSDPDVDIVYIATPHSHHYQHCIQALEASKHEKLA